MRKGEVMIKIILRGFRHEFAIELFIYEFSCHVRDILFGPDGFNRSGTKRECTKNALQVGSG